MQWHYGIYIQTKEAISFKEPLIYPFLLKAVGPELIKRISTFSALSVNGSRPKCLIVTAFPEAARSPAWVRLLPTASSPRPRAGYIIKRARVLETAPDPAQAAKERLIIFCHFHVQQNTLWYSFSLVSLLQQKNLKTQH